jgi:opacity protein-like surface antigen
MKSLSLVLVVMSVSVFAQTTAPVGQIYGGFQYTRLDTASVQNVVDLAALQAGVPTINFGRHQNLYGWCFGGQQNLNGWFGGIVDVGGTYLTRKVLLSQSGGVNTTLRAILHSYTLMAGPQITLRRSATFQPFARGLVGGGFFNDSVNVLVNNVPRFSEGKENDENWAFGGGFGTDVNFSRSLGVRLAIDYIRTQLFNENQVDYRGTVSMVYRFGGRTGIKTNKASDVDSRKWTKKYRPKPQPEQERSK